MAQITPRIQTTIGSLLQWQLSLFYWALHIDTLWFRFVQLSVRFSHHFQYFSKSHSRIIQVKSFFLSLKSFVHYLVFLLMFHYHHFVFTILTHWWHCTENTKLLFHLINNSNPKLSRQTSYYKKQTVLFVVIDPRSSIPMQIFQETQ